AGLAPGSAGGGRLLRDGDALPTLAAAVRAGGRIANARSGGPAGLAGTAAGAGGAARSALARGLGGRGDAGAGAAAAAARARRGRAGWRRAPVGAGSARCISTVRRYFVGAADAAMAGAAAVPGAATGASAACPPAAGRAAAGIRDVPVVITAVVGGRAV